MDLISRPTPHKGATGHVLSYGEGRVCAARGCATKLSRYNATAYCAAAHAEER